ncbi:hypothetical protein JQX13_22725 [Archangium violaceum]|uniref:imm11 family protein n=1 Tax=Archangium violaceum TaxID=83451 RepID=UPI00193BF64D|nr:DUF1629 domain-containing protein [Archangium violaceum]QRK12593.1 hypothetical protein JQX13_22725 [Archangium violaceum]
MHNYFILESHPSPENCTINKCPEPLDSKKWRIAEGEPMGGHYSPPVRLDMDKSHGGMHIPDFIDNNLHLPLVSGKLKQLLERESNAEIEFLPFMLYNHKGRVACDDCYIANVLGSQDCVDRTRTEGQEDASEPGQYIGLFRLFLDPARIDPQSRLFRISAKPSVLIIRDDLRALFEQNEVTGARYIAMGEKCMLY